MTHRLGIAAACIGVIVLGILGFAALMATKPAQLANKTVAVPAAVQAQEVKLGEYTVIVRETGTVEAKTSLDIVAEVSGRVMSVSKNLKTGFFVEKDQLLVEIDRREYKLNVAQAKAQIVQLKAEMARIAQSRENLKRNLEVEQDKLRLSRSELERFADLRRSESISQSELDKQAISTRQMEASVVNQQNSLALIKSQMDLIEAKIEASKAQFEVAKLNLEKTRITAPFNGRVRSESVEVGQYVQVGTRLADIYDISAMEIVVKIPLLRMRSVMNSESNAIPVPPITDFEKINEWMQRIGVSGTVRLNIGKVSFQWPCKVTRLQGALDETTRTVPVVVEVNDPFLGAKPGERPPLLPGMFVEVKLKGKILKNVASIPRNAVHDGKVYVASNTKLEIRDVTVELLTREHAIISKGLEDGDLVIVSPLEAPVQGTAVQVASRQ